MRESLIALVLVCGVASNVFAQEMGDRVPPGGADTRWDGATASRIEPRGIPRDKTFWLMTAALNGAMVLDTHSTFAVLGRCADCFERNPLVAPFVRRGPALTYAAGEVFDAGVMTVAARMRRSPRAWARRVWWVLPASLVAGHALAARHNHGLARHSR